MRIAVGVKSVAEARYYLENGAAEVYCGLAGTPNNRLAVENLSGAAPIREVIALARRLKGRVFLALNDILPRPRYDEACGWIESLSRAGLFGVILKDPAFMAYLKARGLRPYITLSTLSICFNRKALEFFAGLGVSRLVLPMQMMPENAKNLLRNPHGIETEVFCQPLYYGVNLDFLCFLSCPQTGREKSSRAPDFPCLLPFKHPGGRFYMPLPGPEYMLGAFYDYYRAGVSYVKVARWPNSQRQMDLFWKVRHLLKLLDKGISRELFIRHGLGIDARPIQYGKSFSFKPLR